MGRLKKVFADILLAGMVDGIKTAVTLLLIMIPVSFGAQIFQWLGWLEILAKWIAPAFALVGVRGEGAIVFLTGAFLNCYSAIAVIVTVPFTREITILAFMVLVAHNLPVEMAIQKKVGMSLTGMFLLRLITAVLGGAALHFLMAADFPNRPGHYGRCGGGARAIWVHVLGLGRQKLFWGFGKIVLIVIGLMVLHKIFEKTGLIRKLGVVLAPVIWLLGLNRESAFLWVVANTLGLAYGGGIMIRQKEEGAIAERDFKELNISVAVCHSLVEDSLLFMAVGAKGFWIIVPRMILASIAVWGYREIRAMRGK